MNARSGHSVSRVLFVVQKEGTLMRFHVRFLSAVVLCVLGMGSVWAQEQPQSKGALEFYTGPVTIERLSGTIDLQRAKQPDMALEVTLRNTGRESQDVTVSFRGSRESGRAAVEAGKSQPLKLNPPSEWSGREEGTQGVKLDLLLQINGRPVAAPLGAVDLTIILPDGVPALIRSNEDLKPAQAGGRTSYHLRREKTYLTQLNLVFTTGPVTLALSKAIEPSVIKGPGPVRVTLTVRNLGRAAARNVLLEDNYDPRDFGGEGPGYREYTGKENDRRLLWQQTVDSIAPGQTVTVTYQLNARLPVNNVSLNAATATIDRELVGVSNKIELGARSR